MPADQYIGGVEHAILHLLYKIFVKAISHKNKNFDLIEPLTDFTHEWFVMRRIKIKIIIGYTPMRLQQKKLFQEKNLNEKVIVGSIGLCQNQKNTIEPSIMIDKYGADAVRRLYYLTVLLKKMCNG